MDILNPADYSRRDFLKLTGKSAGLLALSSMPFALAACDPNRYFYFAVMADTHIIDEFYKGPEGNPVDTENIFKTAERYIAARDVINTLEPKIDMVFIAGDYIHNYPSTDYNFYFQNKTRFDIAKEITDGFKMPVYPGFGNHDYDIPGIPREFSNALFKEKWGLDPYYYIDHNGFRFIHLNNYLGATMEAGSKDYNDDFGSFGEEQLLWLDNLLEDKKPSFIFFHQPMLMLKANEVADLDIFTVLSRHKDTVKLVIAGHWHRWVDFLKIFGIRHMACASTRYDADSYMIFEVDKQTQDFRILNWPCFGWVTYNTAPYTQKQHKVLAKSAWKDF
jgi:hypothetical protein